MEPSNRLLHALIALLAACMLFIVPTRAMADEAGEDYYVPNEVIVVYEPEYGGVGGPAGAPAEGEELAFGIAGTNDLGGSGTEDDPAMECLTLDLPEGMTLDEAIEQLASLPGVAYAQKNFKYHLPEDDLPDGYASKGLSPEGNVNDPKAQYQWHLDEWDHYGPDGEYWCGAGVKDAWDLAKCNGKVTIAVLDTGCLVDHVDLKANIDTKNMWDAYYGRRVGLMSDPDGHGTHVCGIAGAVANNKSGVAGASYNAKILPIKVFDDKGEGTDSETLVAAYNYLISRIKSGNLTNLHVINMSLGGYEYDNNYDAALEARIGTMRDTYKVLTVCAGGNAYRTARHYPSDFDECLAVTALDQNGDNAWFSDYNRSKDISAPGVDIYSTSTISSNASYEWFGGTSMASPLVAGCAALLWAAVPSLTVDQAIDCIRTTAHQLSASGSYYHSSSQTGSAGAIDAGAAVAYAIQHYGSGAYKTNIREVYGYLERDEYLYDGKAHEPEFISYLEEGVDYTISYVDNVNTGTALAIVQGKGDLYGSVTYTFTITDRTSDDGVEWVRLAGKDRYQTMSRIVTDGWDDYYSRVIIATGEDFKDALAAAGFAGIYGCPVLITKKNELTPETAMMLQRLEPGNIYVAGGKAAVSDAVLDQIAAFTYNTYADSPIRPMRLEGKDSCTTSARIALEARWAWSDTAIIATNKTFKDALSAAPIAYAKHYPILLAGNGKSLDADVLKALTECGISKVIIVGGELAVTPNVVSQLKKHGISEKNITRIAGSTAVETSKKIAQWGLGHGLHPDGMGIATSVNFPDALCGAAYVGRNQSVLLLADDKHLANASFPSSYCYDMTTGYVFGGQSAVGYKTWDRLVDYTRTEFVYPEGGN